MRHRLVLFDFDGTLADSLAWFLGIFDQVADRFGYRRLYVLLKREGYVINHKKLFRLYREEKLAVHRRGGRKRATGPGQS